MGDNRIKALSRFNGVWESGPSNVVGAGMLKRIELAIRWAYLEGKKDGSRPQLMEIDVILDEIAEGPIEAGLCENADQEKGYKYGVSAAVLQMAERLPRPKKVKART